MAKMTLLQIVQSVLNDLESDAVTSITDTPESDIITSTAKDIFYQMVTNKIIPEHYELDQLTAAGSPALVFMQIPDVIAKIEWIKYNIIKTGETRVNFVDIPYCAVSQFITRSHRLDSTASNVVTATDPTSSIDIFVEDDKAPEWWTSFDDEYIAFNSYDAAVDATGLVLAKTLVWARTIPAWTQTDAAVPDIDETVFPLFLAELKSTCFVNLKQTANVKIEQQARGQKIAIQNDRYRTNAAEKESLNATQRVAGRRRP